MGLFDTIFEVTGTILGGSSASSSNNSGYSGLIDSLIGSSQTSPQKKAQSRDEGIYGYGSGDQYLPVGSTFNAYGTQHQSTEAALKHLDETMCYDGTLICPICQRAKESPSAYNRCLREHQSAGYDCSGLFLQIFCAENLWRLNPISGKASFFSLHIEKTLI